MARGDVPPLYFARTASTLTIAVASDTNENCHTESFAFSEFKLAYVDADGGAMPSGGAWFPSRRELSIAPLPL